MARGILGKKLGMTQVFDDTGNAVPVTVVQAGPCVVVQVKTPERDGYEAVQVGLEPARRANRPRRGHFARAGVEPLRYLREFRFEGAAQLEPGQSITVELFEPGDQVDVTGISKGKGFAGGVKRHGFGRGPMTHGSKYHRGPGSLQSRDAARVFKGRKLPGRMGGARVTVQNLEVVRVDPERHLLLIRGAVPGPRGALLQVRAAKKVRRTAKR